MKYRVELSCIYNGVMTVEAESIDDALEIAQDNLNHETLKGFPDIVVIPNATFKFGEATAENAYELI